MTEVTAEQARVAVEVLRAYDRKHEATILAEARRDPARMYCWSARELSRWAEELEHEQVEKAKRDKRIEELAGVLNAGENPAFAARPLTPRHRRMAAALLDHYPSLLDEPGGKS